MADIRNFELTGRWFFDAFVWFIESLNSAWAFLWSPISDYLTADFGDGFLNELFETTVNSTVQLILSLFPEDISVITLIIGSGFVTFLCLTIIGFVRRVI